jgi:class 3 adenylate cyclase
MPGMPGMPDPYGAGGYGSSVGYGSTIGSAGSPGAAASSSGPAQFNYAGTVVGLSAFLSLFVPSWLFAGSFVLPGAALGRRRLTPVLAAAVLALLAAYAALSIAIPDVVGSLPLSRPPFSYALAATSVLLLVVAAWHQFRAYARTWLPTQGALAVAFVLLAEAQMLMAVAPFWTVSWWGYHVLMFSAVVIALTALFVELDRRRALERFVPPELVEGVVTGNLLRSKGERRVATILFADLRDSTKVAEQLPADQVVELLNTYLGTFARVVEAFGGIVDKFLGDGLMAIFGVSEEDRTDGAAPAVQAALEIRRAVDEVNAERTRQGKTTMRFGVAVHTGEVVTGEIEILKDRRSDYTAVGDTVNTASRMGDLNKDLGVEVVLSSETVSRLPEAQFALRQLGEYPVRGRRESVCAYTVA